MLPSVLQRSRAHRHFLGLRRLVIALRARIRFVLVILDALPLDVVLAEADLALQTTVLTVLVARLALVALALQHLAARLMLELIVLAEIRVAE